MKRITPLQSIMLFNIPLPWYTIKTYYISLTAAITSSIVLSKFSLHVRYRLSPRVLYRLSYNEIYAQNLSLTKLPSNGWSERASRVIFGTTRCGSAIRRSKLIPGTRKEKRWYNASAKTTCRFGRGEVYEKTSALNFVALIRLRWNSASYSRAFAFACKLIHVKSRNAFRSCRNKDKYIKRISSAFCCCGNKDKCIKRI